MIPSKKEAPVIFIYDYGDQNHVFCIAPRNESDSELFEEKASQSHDSESKK